MNKKTRVLFCGSHPYIYNGYSKVLFELINELSNYQDLHITHFGFQNPNSQNQNNHIQIRQHNNKHNNVYVYDAMKYENLNLNKFEKDGFGYNLFRDFVLTNSPDIIIIYNDPNIITNLYKQIEDLTYIKKIQYFDFVYKNNNIHMMQYINS